MKRLILVLAALGVSFFAYGAYIPAKAVLAQYLINDAWNDSIRSGESHKPWKWAHFQGLWLSPERIESFQASLIKY